MLKRRFIGRLFLFLHRSYLEMKKNVVLFVLFVLPIVAYLFFASGVNQFATLPIVTKEVPEITATGLDGIPVTLDGKITVLGFGGHDLRANRGNIFNLNMKVYQRYHEFKDLQFVMLCPKGTEEDADYILQQLEAFTNTSRWKFAFADDETIRNIYASLQLKDPLGTTLGTPNVFIIDKNRSLRGRKGDAEFEAGYSTFHPSELSNEMLDDFKIILYEYRAALKKNNNATKRLGT